MMYHVCMYKTTNLLVCILSNYLEIWSLDTGLRQPTAIECVLCV